MTCDVKGGPLQNITNCIENNSSHWTMTITTKKDDKSNRKHRDEKKTGHFGLSNRHRDNAACYGLVWSYMALLALDVADSTNEKMHAFEKNNPKSASSVPRTPFWSTITACRSTSTANCPWSHQCLKRNFWIQQWHVDLISSYLIWSTLGGRRCPPNFTLESIYLGSNGCLQRIFSQ